MLIYKRRFIAKASLLFVTEITKKNVHSIELILALYEMLDSFEIN